MARSTHAWIAQSLTNLLRRRRIVELAAKLGVVRRRRELDIVALVHCLVLGFSQGTHLVNNWIHDNNRENTAPGGILYLGVDESLIAGNLVENNEFTGIAIADYCAVVTGIPDERFRCGIDPDTQDPDFLVDQTAMDNRVEDASFFSLFHAALLQHLDPRVRGRNRT
jgi:hypothetical protein